MGKSEVGWIFFLKVVVEEVHEGDVLFVDLKHRCFVSLGL